ncbi:MAG: DUF389 domain-containing protein [Bacteroidales bacterium]|nr:DUF389 domain-containing protein [Bacteroidales bacterium]
MNLLYRAKEAFRRISGMKNDLDTADAAERIKKGIWFKGANVWILACAIVIASLGLNVNSTAVIIGAMLISPVMGPILGIGLAVGTNDVGLLKMAAKNLIVMVLISLIASCVYFVLSPLNLADPTELMSRTSPTIYDVLIAFFGGLAGILENSRKERGTVLSGVAIATALMPPLCTAGFGLANLNMQYFFGAMYLFLINAIFIATATYLGVKFLHFPESGAGTELAQLRKRRRVISTFFVIILVPSFITAYNLVKDNQFTSNARAFVTENRVIGKTYIYDYNIYKDGGNRLLITLAGEPLSQEQRAALQEKAAAHGIKAERLVIYDASYGIGDDEVRDIVNSIYAHTDESILARDARIQELKDRLDKMDSLLKVHFPDSSAVAGDSLPESGQDVLPEPIQKASREPEKPVDVGQILELLKK